MAKTCVNFSKKCGGCPLLALPYPRQTAEKQQRLQRAAELLCGTTLQVTAIAAQCGFEDSSYFARSFRQLYGCGPTEFRRRTLRAGQ